MSKECLTKVYLSIIVILMINISLYFTVYDKDNREYDYSIEYVDDLDKVYDIYCLDINDNIIITKMKFPDSLNSDSLYKEIFKVYNEYQNSLPSMFYSPLTSVVDYTISIDNNTINLSIDKISMDCNIGLLKKCLQNTYYELGVTKLIINVGLNTSPI